MDACSRVLGVDAHRLRLGARPRAGARAGSPGLRLPADHPARSGWAARTTPNDRPAPSPGDGRGAHARGPALRALRWRARSCMGAAPPSGTERPLAGASYALHRRGGQPRLGGVQPAPRPSPGRRADHPCAPRPALFGPRGVHRRAGARRCSGCWGDRLLLLPDAHTGGPAHPRLPPPVRRSRTSRR